MLRMTKSSESTMHPELHVKPNIYSGRFPRFNRPKIIGYIDIDNLKFARQVREEKVQYDLNLLLDEAKHRPPDLDVKLNELLKFLLANERRLNYSEETNLDKSKFFCYRGLLTSIACTPYENQEPWKIVAILHKGNIYLCARPTEEKLYRKMNMSDKEKQFTSWGYKFEQYILSDDPDSSPNPNTPVDESEEFSLVFTTRLNLHTIVYGAEMDGIRCDKAPVKIPPKESGPEAVIEYLSNQEFIELKTSRLIEHPRQETSFRRFKAKKWWLQSYLVDINTILCGFRNDDGMVEELKLFKVNDLAQNTKRFWDSNICFNFLDTFLTYVKRCFAREIRCKYGEPALKNLQELPLMSFLFEWQPGMPVQVSRNYSHEDDPILLPWFIDGFGKIEK